MKKKIFPLIIIAVSVLIFSGCQKSKISVQNDNQIQPSPVKENKAETADEVNNGEENTDYSGWQTYTNEKYKYQVKYPSGWFFMKDYCCPPPPASINLNNISDKKAEFAAKQINPGTQWIDIDCLYEGKIDDIGEVTLQKQEGKQFETKKINGLDAIVFSQDRGPGQPVAVFTWYIVDGKQGCRLGHESGCTFCQNIVNSFNYIN